MTQFTAWPEMLTYPWFMERGFQLYKDIVHPYLPLLPFTLWGFFKIFGFTILNLHVFTLGIFWVIDGLIFYVTNKRFGLFSAVLGCLFFIFCGFILDGNSLWFDVFGIPFLIVALLLFDNKKDSFPHRLFYAGFLIGLAILVKQTYLIFLFPTVALLIPHNKKIIALCFGASMPLLIVSIIFFFNGQFKEFAYWGLWHPVFVHAAVPGFALLPTRRELFISLFLFLPIVLFGFRTKSRLWLLSLCISFLFAIPRFAYFHLMPAAALSSFLLPNLIGDKKIKLLIAGYLLVVGSMSYFFINKDWGKPVRFFDNEVLNVKIKIEQYFGNNKAVYFYNVPSQYFVLSEVLPVKPWVDTFPWYLEVPGMQERLVQSLENTQYVLFAPFQQEGAYTPGSYKPQIVDNFIKQNFRLESKISPELLILKRVN